jgi:hypothetical protein
MKIIIQMVLEPKPKDFKGKYKIKKNFKTFYRCPNQRPMLRYYPNITNIMLLSL